MHELIDRWILPVSGQTVTRCCVDAAFSIELSTAGCAEATISISGTFDLQSKNALRRLRPERGASTLAPALGLLGLTVDHAEAYKDGTLELAFSDGSRVRVAPDPVYEAWEFAGGRGAKAVALPGGDLAVWRPAA
jgi:hypothetical protein